VSDEWSPDLARLQAFDDDEWLKVEQHYAGRLYAYVARRIHDRTAREDVVQEAFLGSVRGIAAFDPTYTFEQYLFGICRNRTIDFMRRRRAAAISPRSEEEDQVVLDHLARDEETPSRVVRNREIRGRGRTLLAEVLRAWVQETWELGEFRRLMVIEALFSGGWRNRDTWRRFELRDETAVAGIKFRALKRMHQLAAVRDEDNSLVPALAAAARDGEAQIDVAEVWKECRASCPARHWLARHVAGTLEEGPRAFVDFHLTEMSCPWCQANRDDLERSEEALEPLLERVRASTARYLRSKTVR
jgi:RNA polymerase sigma-70 factor (ECF subfamily)